MPPGSGNTRGTSYERVGQGAQGSAEMVAAAIRTIFARPDAAAVGDQLDSIAAKLGRQFPAVETMLREAAPDICAFAPPSRGPLEEDLQHQPAIG